MTQFTFPADVKSFVDTGIFIKADGSRVLSGDWDIGAGRKILAEAIQARAVVGSNLVFSAGYPTPVQVMQITSAGVNIGTDPYYANTILSVCNDDLQLASGAVYFIDSHLTTKGTLTGNCSMVTNQYIVTNNTANPDSKTLNIFAFFCQAKNPPGYLCSLLAGFFLTASSTHTAGTLGTSSGAIIGAQHNGAGGTVATLQGGRFTYGCVSGTVEAAYAGHFAASGTLTGTIDNAYGVYIGTMFGTAKWSLYAADDTAPSYFAGNAGFGISSPTAQVDINSDTLRLRTSKTPASAGDAGNAGDICWNSGYLYVCVATDTWKRAALSTWT